MSIERAMERWETAEDEGLVVIVLPEGAEEGDADAWHGYAGPGPNEDTWTSMLLGPTRHSPVPAVPSPWADPAPEPLYVCSWPYEPSDEEQDHALGRPA